MSKCVLKLRLFRTVGIVGHALDDLHCRAVSASESEEGQSHALARGFVRVGERRAQAVKNVLVASGIPASRISTISDGKERPIVVGSNEEAWAQNRVAITTVN